MAQDDGAHWRDLSRTPRFYFIDAYSVFPFLLAALHASYWTFGFAAVMTLFFAVLERFEFTLPIFRLWFKSSLAGPHRTAKPWWRQ